MLGKSAFALAVIVVCIFAVATHGQKPGSIVFSGFYNGEQFLDLSDNYKMLYSSGLIDGLVTSALLGAPNQTAKAVSECIKSMDNKQVTAILTKYGKDHPESWTLPMGIHAFNAISDICPDVKKIDK